MLHNMSLYFVMVTIESALALLCLNRADRQIKVADLRPVYCTFQAAKAPGQDSEPYDLDLYRALGATLRGEQKDAEEYARKQLKILLLHEDPLCKGQTLKILAHAVHHQRREAEAEGYYSQAITIFKGLGRDDLLFETLRNLSIVYSHLGLFSDREVALEACLRYYRSKKSEEEVAFTLQLLGHVTCASGDTKTAERHYLEAEAILRKGAAGTNKSAISENLLYLVYTYIDAKNVNKAKDCLDVAIKLDIEITPTVRCALGLISAAQGNEKLAEAEIRQALNAASAERNKNPVGYADALEAVGILALQKKEFTEARKCFEEVIKIGKKHYGANHPYVARGLEHLGRTSALQGEDHEAKTFLAAARDIRERSKERRRKSFLDGILIK